MSLLTETCVRAAIDSSYNRLEEVMQQALDNTLRGSLAKSLVQLSQQPEHQVHRDWAVAQQKSVREQLKPLASGDITLLLEIGQTEGMPFFADV